MRFLRLFFIGFCLFILPSHAKSSIHSDMDGWGLYDNHLNHPAFIVSNNKFNFDLYGFTHQTKMDYWNPKGLLFIGRIGLNQINSGLELQYFRSTLANTSTNSITMGYSYKKAFNDILNLSAGFAYNLSNQNVKIEDSPTTDFKEVNLNTHDLDVGIGIELKQFIFGFNNNLVLQEKNILSAGPTSDSTSIGAKFEYSYFNLIASYKFNLLDKFTLTPQFEYVSDYKSFISILFGYSSKYKFGVTYDLEKSIISDNHFMISGSYTFADKIQFVLFIIPSSKEFIYNSESGLNLSAKIGVKF